MNSMNLIPYDVIGLICKDLPLSDYVWQVKYFVRSRQFCQKALNSKKLAYCWHYKYRPLKMRRNTRRSCHCNEIITPLLYGNINIIQPIPLYEMHTGPDSRRPDQ